jgi:hypothetical protein
MSRDSTVIPFRQPDAIDDPLTELAREGARRMLAQALIAEADAFVAMWKEKNWSRLSEQFFRIDKWSVCRG